MKAQMTEMTSDEEKRLEQKRIELDEKEQKLTKERKNLAEMKTRQNETKMNLSPGELEKLDIQKLYNQLKRRMFYEPNEIDFWNSVTKHKPNCERTQYNR